MDLRHRITSPVIFEQCSGKAQGKHSAELTFEVVVLIRAGCEYKILDLFCVWFCYEFCLLFNKNQQIQKEEGVDKVSDQMRLKDQ